MCFLHIIILINKLITESVYIHLSFSTLNSLYILGLNRIFNLSDLHLSTCLTTDGLFFSIQFASQTTSKIIFNLSLTRIDSTSITIFSETKCTDVSV